MGAGRICSEISIIEVSKVKGRDLIAQNGHRSLEITIPTVPIVRIWHKGLIVTGTEVVRHRVLACIIGVAWRRALIGRFCFRSGLVVPSFFSPRNRGQIVSTNSMTSLRNVHV